MRRVVALFLPTFPTDHLRRMNAGVPPVDVAMVTAAPEGNRSVIASVDETASRLKLRVGMTIAHAQSLVPDLAVAESNPAQDEAALARLGLWCTRYSPLVTPSPPDGLFIDVAGSAHLFKGEAALLKDMLSRVSAAKLCARAAIADTPGCAWAVCRYGSEDIVAPGRMADVLGSLPVAALRLADKTIESLRDVGIERIAQLASKPRASLQTRFGSEVLLRLDQALGTAMEVLVPLTAPEVPRTSMKFMEPVADPEDLARIVAMLCEKLMRDLEVRGVGSRRLDLVFTRVDNVTQAVRIGTSRPNRDVPHLTKLLNERLVLVDPGFGIESASLVASWVEAMSERQTIGAHIEGAGEEVELANLIDTLRIRLGPDRVFKLAPVESDIPERSTKRIAAISDKDLCWPCDLPRPARLLAPPELVQAAAEIPDAPPLFFVWRKHRHKIVKADGPERILGEWWVSDKDAGMQRDYYRVEDDAGERFWLFRDAPADQGGQWWLHGLGEA
jgi:protein ImuB